MNTHVPQHSLSSLARTHNPLESSAEARQYDQEHAAVGMNANGPLPVPPGRQGAGNGNGFAGHVPRNSGSGAFDMSRSPPSGKNTSHVPCKFFLQGNCQAGSACPFKHSNDAATTVEVCKYFQKGNCKYGRKCLLAHILPNGQRVNGPNFGANVYHQAQRPSLGGQFDPLAQNSYAQISPAQQAYPFSMHDASVQQNKSYDLAGVSGLSSHPGSPFGSPPGEGRLAMSPSAKAHSALDAPLPSSFDSQGMSNYATYGPTGVSVPSRFGFGPLASTSPPVSTNSHAFSNLNSLALSDAKISNNLNQLASSPPSHSAETAPRKILHSEKRSKPQMISSSLPVGARPIGRPDTADDEGEDNTTFQEDLLPGSLSELMTPEEKMRRFSRNEEDGILGFRQSLSGFGSPIDSKSGSPSAASPSRYSALFAAKQRREDNDSYGASAFGHVGSPLRNSSLNMAASPSLGPVSRPRSGEVSPFVSSPPRHGGMSMISQQLSRTHLDSKSENLDPNANYGLGNGRGASGSSIGAALGGPGRLGDRAISSSSIGRDKIDEEPFLFSMEDEEELREKERKREAQSTVTGLKRYSGGGWNIASSTSGKSSPRAGAIGAQRTASSGRDMLRSLGS